MATKDAVRDFWNEAACGEKLLLPSLDPEGFAAQAQERYRLEPYIIPFADFANARNLKVLEVGVGLGADHEAYARAGANLYGIDLTPRSIEIVRTRFALQSLQSDLRVADAEMLPFDDNSFDLVYSWGVIHHSPDTAAAAREILRVLKPGGRFRIMIYHKWSLVGAMLWLRYGLARGRPLMSLAQIYANYLESPGTKAFTRREARELFRGAASVTTKVELTHGDLLESAAGQRHAGPALAIARRLWPRWFLRRACRQFGLFLLISGTK